MQDVYEIRDQLNELSNIIEEYEESHKNLATTKDEYIALRTKMPLQKVIKSEKEPFSTTPIRIGLLVLLLLFVSSCVFGLVSYWILQLITIILPVISIVTLVYQFSRLL